MKTAASYLIKQAILGSMFPQPVKGDKDKKSTAELSDRLKRRRNMPAKKLSFGELMMC